MVGLKKPVRKVKLHKKEAKPKENPKYQPKAYDDIVGAKIKVKDTIGNLKSTHNYNADLVKIGSFKGTIREFDIKLDNDRPPVRVVNVYADNERLYDETPYRVSKEKIRSGADNTWLKHTIWGKQAEEQETAKKYKEGKRVYSHVQKTEGYKDYKTVDSNTHNSKLYTPRKHKLVKKHTKRMRK